MQYLGYTYTKALRHLCIKFNPMPYIVSGNTTDNRVVTETHTIPASYKTTAILASGPPKIEFPSGSS